jgi:MFS superfamily sulfate permease-like transporter
MQQLLVALPGLVLCRLEAPLCYANAQSFMDEVLSSVWDAPSTPRWVVLECDSIGEIDYVGAQTLTELADRIASKSVKLAFVGLTARVRGFLSDFGAFAILDRDNIFPSVDAAVSTFERLAHSSTAPNRM